MARVSVNGGNCGFKSVIEVESIDRTTVRVSIESDCDRITAMNSELGELSWRNCLFGKMNESHVFEVASRHVRHLACPVPMAILKAMEVELHMALPMDIVMHFESPVRQVG